MNLLYARTEAFLSVLISQNLLVWEVSKIVMRTSPIRYIFLGAGEIELRGTFLAKQEGKASQSGGRKRNQKYNLVQPQQVFYESNKKKWAQGRRILLSCKKGFLNNC